MKHKIVESLHGVTLAGGGPFGAALLARALALAPVIVGADGGADRLLRLGAEPTAVIGDFDSISATARARLAGRLCAGFGAAGFVSCATAEKTAVVTERTNRDERAVRFISSWDRGFASNLLQ